MDLATRFALTLHGLLRQVAHRLAPDRAMSPAVCALFGRMNRMVLRMEALLARYRAGTLPPSKQSTEPKAPKPAMFGPPAPRKPDPVPRRYGWIARLGHHERGFASQLQFLLVDPEMKAFLAAAPQAWRILRPLCRMLEIEPGVNGVPFPPPPKPRRPRPPKVQPPPPAPVRPLARRFWPPGLSRAQRAVLRGDVKTRAHSVAHQKQ